MYLRKLHLPSLGVLGLVFGALVRTISLAVHSPIIDLLVSLSNIVLLMSIAWILMFDLFPIFLEPFYFIRHKYPRRQSFFVALLVLFVLFQMVTIFLPSGRTKDITTTLAFISFISVIFWVLGILLTAKAPVIRFLKRKPREIEKVEFSDVVESMAIILTPTIALSFIFFPTGLSRQQITPYHVFITSILTAICILAYLYLVIIRPKIFTLRQLGLRKIDREDFGKAAVLFLFVSTLIVILETLLERLGVSLQQYSFATREGAIYAFLAVVLITPFAEELYFRGFVFKGLMLHRRPWIAYLSSSLLFAVLHPPLIVMVEVFLIGLLLAYIVKETKSIWPGVLIHMINNAIVFGYLLYR